MVRKILVLTLSLLLLVCPHASEAAKKGGGKKKKPKPPPVDLAKIVTVQVDITDKKGTRTYDVTCYENTPGQLNKNKFTAFTKILRDLSPNKNKNKKLKQRYQLMRALNTAGKEECVQPDYLSLEPYRGPFTAKEASILYDRFAFGAGPEQIAYAVGLGLTGTINDIQTARPEPNLDADEAEFRCDHYLADDTRNETFDFDECPPGNRNAVQDQGVRFDMYNRMWHSANGYYLKLWMFLHDERMAAGSNVLQGCDRYALVDHVNLLRRAAGSGDYIQFMRDWNNDYLGHLVWLDGATNTGQKPNENYAREFWELGTVGPTGLDGNPVYTDLDIAQSALAFSGWIRDDDDFVDNQGDEYRLCFGAKAPAQHAPGPKTIFAGTPYARTVDNDEDVLQATFAHPRTAEHLAEDLWKEFINPYARPKEIQQLAQLIRDFNYKLHPVMTRIMGSRAMFAARSRKSLIKQPVEMVFGFLRQTGIPLWDNTYVDEDTGRTLTGSSRFEELEWRVIDEVGQTPLLPPTVFGWNERRLAGEQWVLPWRNALMWLINRDSEDMAEHGFSFRDKFFAGLPPAGSAAPALIDKVAAILNVDVNENQKTHLVTFMDYDYVNCSQQERRDPSKQCDVAGKRLRYRVFDPHPQSAEENVTDTRGLIAILATHPSYRMK